MWAKFEALLKKFLNFVISQKSNFEQKIDQNSHFWYFFIFLSKLKKLVLRKLKHFKTFWWFDVKKFALMQKKEKQQTQLWHHRWLVALLKIVKITCEFLKMGQSRPIFVYFRLFHATQFNELKKAYVVCLGLNLGQQDGRCRWIHWAMAAPLNTR